MEDDSDYILLGIQRVYGATKSGETINDYDVELFEKSSTLAQVRKLQNTPYPEIDLNVDDDDETFMKKYEWACGDEVDKYLIMSEFYENAPWKDVLAAEVWMPNVERCGVQTFIAHTLSEMAAYGFKRPDDFVEEELTGSSDTERESQIMDSAKSDEERDEFKREMVHDKCNREKLISIVLESKQHPKNVYQEWVTVYQEMEN